MAVVNRFDSVAEYARFAQSKNAPATHSQGHSWDLGVTGVEACKRALEGDPTIAPRIQTIVDGIKAHDMGMMARSRNVRSVYGAYPSVPAYLAGNPMAMRRRVKMPVDAPHVSIYVGVYCSAAANADKMLTRGSCILGLLESLQSMQIGVDLYILGEGWGRTDGTQFTVVRVNTQPLDLATSGFALAHPAFARNVMYETEKKQDGHTGAWPSGHAYQGTRGFPHYMRTMRAAIGARDTDLIFPGPFSGDPTLLATDPSTWVQAQLTSILKGTEAA